MTVSHATKRRWNAAPAPSNAETGNWSLYSLPWGRSNPTYCYYEQRRRIWFCAQLLDAKWKPDFGPAEYIPNWGASVVGARKFLIAYNVNLLSTKEQAHRIALDVREQGRGPEQVRPPQTLWRRLRHSPDPVARLRSSMKRGRPKEGEKREWA